MKPIIILLSSFFCCLAHAQSLDANRLALHNGGEYWVQGFDHDSVNCGAGKYYPSFTHWPAQGSGTPCEWPWKIRGWTWTGMQAQNHGPTWFWATALMYSVDNPWDKRMTFKYPVLHGLGLVPHSGPPWVIYSTSGLPKNLPSVIAGKEMGFPSSHGGFDPYLNIFTVGWDTWVIPSTTPYYGWEFSFCTQPTNTITLPSGQSIFQYTWEWLGPFGQYQVISGNEMDCTLTNGGNKARCYILGKHGDCNCTYYLENWCSGNKFSWDMSLLLNDAVTIPVNVPGSSNASNPFAVYGFDVGVATITPLASSGQCSLMFMTEDFAHPGTSRIILAASPYSGPGIPYGPVGYRIPHAWDCTTNFFLQQAPVWFHQLLPGYPASAFGTTVGGHSAAVPLPAHPDLLCLELRFSSFSTCGWAPSASFMVTYF